MLPFVRAAFSLSLLYCALGLSLGLVAGCAPDGEADEVEDRPELVERPGHVLRVTGEAVERTPPCVDEEPRDP